MLSSPGASALHVRRAEPADAPALAALAARTFRESYLGLGVDDDVELYVDAHFGEGHQAGELADPSLITLLLEAGEAPAGYAQLRLSPLPAGVAPGHADARPAELSRFYVDRRWHGRGLAALLMRGAFDAVRARGANLLWLSVWRINGRAIAFYRKCGFEIVGETPFVMGNDRQMDHVMARRLDDLPPLPEERARTAAG